MADGTTAAPEAAAPEASEAPDVTTMSEEALIEHAWAEAPAAEEDSPEDAPPPAAAEDAPPEPAKEGEGEAQEGDKPEGEEGDKKDEPAEDGPHERAWSSIRRKEKELVDQRSEFKREQEAVAVERQQFQKLNDSVREMQAEVRKDPLGFLQRAAGYSMDDLVRLALADDGKAPAPTGQPQQQQGEDPVRKELAELRQLIQSQNEARQHEKALSEYRNDLSSALADSRYELLGAYRVMTPDGATMNAADVIEYRAALDAQRGEQILTVQDYADRLLSEYKEDLTSKASHGAVRKVLGLTDAPPSPGANGGNSPPPQPGTEPTTLTNSLATPRRPQPETLPDFSDEEAVIADALRAISD